MSGTILTTGLACIIAAIIGGGLKAFGIEIPILKSLKRQIVLATFGILLLCGYIISTYFTAGNTQYPLGNQPPPSKPSPIVEQSKIDRDKLFLELQNNKANIEKLEQGLAEHSSQYEIQEERITLQERAIARGEGTAQSREEAKAAIKAARIAIDEARKADKVAQEIIGRTKQRNLEIERILANN